MSAAWTPDGRGMGTGMALNAGCQALGGNLYVYGLDAGWALDINRATPFAILTQLV